MRRLTNFRSILPRLILLLFLSPFIYFFLAILHKIAITGIRCRETRKVNPLYTGGFFFFLYKLGSATRSRNRHLGMAPELDKYYFEKKKRLSSSLMVSTCMHPVYGPHEAFSLLCDLDAALAGVNLIKAESTRPQEQCLTDQVTLLRILIS